MMWHGVKQNKTNSIIRKSKHKVNKAIAKYSWDIRQSTQMNKQTFYFYKPSGWDALLFRNKHTGNKIIFFYSNQYYFKLSLPLTLSHTTYDPNVSCFTVHTLYVNNNYRMFLNQLNLVFSAFYRPFFAKLNSKVKAIIFIKIRGTLLRHNSVTHTDFIYTRISYL